MPAFHGIDSQHTLHLHTLEVLTCTISSLTLLLGGFEGPLDWWIISLGLEGLSKERLQRLQLLRLQDGLCGTGAQSVQRRPCIMCTEPES